MINKKKLLILGATGQVGKELSLHLIENKKIDLICHARSGVSSAFLRNKNINCIISDLKSEKLKTNIKNADLIFDLAAPSTGNLRETKKFYKDRINYIFENMSIKSKFVFASTMNAFGLSERNRKLKNYLIPSSIYAANKRFAEELIIKEGKQRNFETYVVRLSNVHGNLQRASNEIKELILNDYVFEIPSTSAWIVFVSTIYEMLISILENKEKPGKYTLVNDEIFWPDLLEFFAKKLNKKVKYRVFEKENNIFLNKVKNYIYNLILSRKDLIRGNFSVSEEFETKKKIEHRVNIAKDAMIKLDGYKIYHGLNIYEGVLPGKRFKNIINDKNLIFSNNSKYRDKNSNN